MRVERFHTGDLEAVAAQVIGAIEASGCNVVAFDGEMGAGKTTLIREICRQLGCEDNVTSPTFAIVNRYEGRCSVAHFDFYRIARLEEAYDLGYEEYFYGNALCLVEWPEKVEPLLPDRFLHVAITIDDPEHRTIEITER